MGAGRKDENNAFTGILMGTVSTSTKEDIGLLGYSNGERTLFLNSENGAAIFGKTNSGQIIVDPKIGQALLYNHNYWENYGNDGLPSSYTTGNEKSSGMLIDLSEPAIKWGNGNFSVDKNGYIKAIKGESAGWTLSTDSLSSSGKAKIFTGKHDTLKSSENGFLRTLYK